MATSRVHTDIARHYWRETRRAHSTACRCCGARTMHAKAQRTEPALLPEVVAELIEGHESRRRTCLVAWREQIKAAQVWQAGHEWMAADIDLDAGLEL